MRQFAQIQDGFVHWVFEHEEFPEFAPYIKIVEVTDRVVKPLEGWQYNKDTDEFIETTPKILILPSQVTRNTPMSPAEITSHLYILDQAGVNIPAHQHSNDHWAYILSGAIDLIDGGITSSHIAGEMLFLKAKQDHEIIATQPNTRVITIFFNP